MFVQVALITFAERNKMRLFKKKRQCKIVYNKLSEKYYGAWNSLRLNDDEVLIDEYMTEDEAGDIAKSLNQELGMKLYYHDATYMVTTKRKDEKETTSWSFQSYHEAKEYYERESKKNLEQCYFIMFKDGAMTHLGGHGVIEI